MIFYTYVIRSGSTGKIYIGQTNNLIERIRQHNDPKCKLGLYTKKNKGPWRLIYFEKLSTRKEACKREKQLKTARGRKFIKEKILGP